MKPSRASSAAKAPLREACPTCSGLVIVPKLALRPLANEAAIESAVAVSSSLSRSSFAEAAAAPKTPSVAVGCQPLS